MANFLKNMMKRFGGARRLLSKTPQLQFKTTEPLRGNEMPDPFLHATGLEKKELMAVMAGNKDPFHCFTVIKRTPSTKDAPIEIPSAFEGRLIGCACCENRFVQWMWLEEGEPKRCECSHWFKLKKVEPLQA